MMISDHSYRLAPPRRLCPLGTAIVATVLAVMGLAACGNTHKSRSAAKPTSVASAGGNTSTTTAANPLIGTYEANFDGSERFGPSGHDIALVPNQHNLTLQIAATLMQITSERGTNGGPIGPSYSLAGDRLTIDADPTCSHLYPPQATPGIYTYAIADTTLTFQLVSDTCLDRAGDLTAHPWHKTRF